MYIFSCDTYVFIYYFPAKNSVAEKVCKEVYAELNEEVKEKTRRKPKYYDSDKKEPEPKKVCGPALNINCSRHFFSLYKFLGIFRTILDCSIPTKHIFSHSYNCPYFSTQDIPQKLQIAVAQMRLQKMRRQQMKKVIHQFVFGFRKYVSNCYL